MNIGKALKEVRRIKKLSQSKAATAIKIPQGSLSKMETGKIVPDLKTIDKISKGYNVPSALIMYLAVEPKDIRSDRKDFYKALDPIMKRLIKKLIAGEKIE